MRTGLGTTPVRVGRIDGEQRASESMVFKFFPVVNSIPPIFSSPKCRFNWHKPRASDDRCGAASESMVFKLFRVIPPTLNSANF
eukprot:CAMPEP_0203743980 /NCGR_PEP_ID=MMETSP0098-20131031/210_1 /ASSEMBLY_ACC=CAM_ASM_000208 /TAXON_ID=96639 /ORGANISM=" , Strain NY0313808BC1" /LENGTH=83 /DNA_ID=CAMNT_0050631375 /DNA_START=559 /DNA_END=807 /DNA_ORIENTATION=-